jgi:hypothetical protein
MQNSAGKLRALALVAAVAVLSLASAPAVHANTTELLVEGDGWVPFYFSSTSSSWVYYDPTQPSPPFNSPPLDPNNHVDFTFTLSAPAFLNVTDAYLPGDQFDVKITGGPYVGIHDLGDTTVVPFTNTPNVYNDFSSAFGNSDFSHGHFELGPGTYDVTGTAIATPSVSGQAGIELVAATPLPATWTMLLMGLAGIGFAASRRSTRDRSATATV